MTKELQIYLGKPLILLLGILILSACSDSNPVKVGFIAGTSGRVADLGIGGRNGALLAVEERNRRGGIQGHQIELLLRDDEQIKEKARQGVNELIDAGAELIVGPMTSSMGMAVVDIANRRDVVLISPTATTTLLAGLDDNFFRVINTTRRYGKKHAQYHIETQQVKQVVAAIDLNNSAYTEQWINDYRTEFEKLGGQLVHIEPFNSGPDLHFDQIANSLLANDSDAIILVCNSVDAALLIQQLRRLNYKKIIAISEWASTERLVQLGGAAVEGVMTAQFLDRDDQTPAYLDFRQRYIDRFASEPGFAGVAGYEAMTIALNTLANKSPSQTIKEALLATRVYKGVQEDIQFDATGDASRKTFMSVIEGGAFKVVE